MNATSEYAPPADSAPTGSASGNTTRPLNRPAKDRMIAGVAAGCARFLGIDPAAVRIGFVVLVLAGGAGVPLYLAAWLLIPEERSGRSLASDLLRSVSAP